MFINSWSKLFILELKKIEQAAYQPGQSTIEQIQTIQQKLKNV